MRWIILTVALFCGWLATGQSITDHWYRQKIYQVESVEIDQSGLIFTNLESVRLGQDSLSAIKQALGRDVQRMALIDQGVIDDTLGYLIVRVHPDSSQLNVVQYRFYQSGMVGMLPVKPGQPDLETAHERGRQVPQRYEWLESRLFLSDSLVGILSERPGLMEVSKADVIRVLEQYNRYKPVMAEYLRLAERPPSRFAVSALLRHVVERLFLQVGYNPYQEFRIHPFDRFQDDPQVRALLEASPKPD